MLKDCIRQTEFAQVRFAKSPGQSQKGFKRVHRVFSLKKVPGDRVDERDVIGTQRRLNYHPGLNVGINPRDKTLYAICAGTVYYSIEKFVPNQSNPLVQQYYTNKVDVKSDLELTPRYVKYVHVVPDKTTNEFRLIDIV